MASTKLLSLCYAELLFQELKSFRGEDAYPSPPKEIRT
jgi:hypothetical protein